MPEDREKRPGVFANIAQYTPIVAGVSYGGYQVYRTLLPNRGSFVDALRTGFPDTGREHLTAIGRMGKASLQHSIDRSTAVAGAMVGEPLKRASLLTLAESLVRGDQNRTLRTAASAFISILHDPRAGISKKNIETNLATVMAHIDTALQGGMNNELYNQAMGSMESVLIKHRVSQGLVERRMAQIYRGVPLSELQSMRFRGPTEFTPSLIAQEESLAAREASGIQRFLLKKAGLQALPSGMKLNTNVGYRIGGQKYVQAVLSQQGQRGALKFMLPLGPNNDILIDPRSLKAGRSITRRNISQFLASTGGSADVRKIISGKSAIWNAFASIVGEAGAGQRSWRDLRNLAAREMDVLMSFGMEVEPPLASSARLGRFIRSKQAFLTESLQLAREGKGAAVDRDLLARIITKNPEFEILGPQQVARGGLITTPLLSRWFTGTELLGESWAARPYQSLRHEASWIPTDLGKRSKAMSWFHPTRPINPGALWEKELVGEFGERGPQFLQLHVFDSEAAKVLEKYGMVPGAGQIVMKQRVRSKLQTESFRTVNVVESGIGEVLESFMGDPTRQPVLVSNKERGSILGAPGRWKKIRKVIGMSPGGKPVMGARERHIVEEIVAVDRLKEGYKVTLRQTKQPIAGAKIHGGITSMVKGTVDFLSGRTFGGMIRSVFKSTTVGSNSGIIGKLARDVTTLTASSQIPKAGLLGLESGTAGAFKWVTAIMHEEGKLSSGIMTEAEQLLKAENLMDYIGKNLPTMGVSATQKQLEDRSVKYVKNIARMVERFGIKDPAAVGLIFGSAIGGKGVQEKFGTNILRVLSKKMGFSFEEALDVAKTATVAMGEHLVSTDPFVQRARRARLEASTIDLIMQAGMSTNIPNVSQAYIQDLLTQAHSVDPGKILSLNAMNRMFTTATNIASPDEFANYTRIEMNRANLAHLSASEWFKGKGALLELPPELRTAAKSVGMGEFLFVPGEESTRHLVAQAGKVAPEEDIVQIGMGKYRRQSLELGEQHYREFIDNSFREIREAMSSTDQQLQEETLRRYQQGVQRFLYKAQEDITRIPLGPGSGYHQAAMITPNMTSEMVTKYLGENFFQGKQFRGLPLAVMTRAEALEKTQGISATQWEGMGLTRAEFLAGKKSALGMVWRHPVSGERSFAPVEYWVSQAKTTDQAPRTFFMHEPVDVKISGKPHRFDVGIAPGMKLDVDGDFVSGKIVTDQGSIRTILAHQDELRASEKVWQQRALDQQVLSEVLGKRAVEYSREVAEGKVTDYSAKATAAYKLHTGKAVGPISKVLEEIQFAMTAYGDRPELTSQANQLFYELKERVTLKARKLESPVAIGDILASEFYSTGRRNVGSFLSVVRDVLGPSFGEEIAYQVEGQPGTRSIKVGEELFTYVTKAFNEYTAAEGGDVQDLWSAISLRGGVNKATTMRAASLLREGKGAVSPRTAFLQAALETGEESAVKKLIGAASEITDINLETMGRGAKRVYDKISKKIPGPLMLGLAGSAVLFTVFGDPGYAKEPLIEEGETVDPRILKAIQEGSVLSPSGEQQPLIDPNDLLPKGGGPTANPRLMTPSAPIIMNSSDVRIRTSGQDLRELDYNNLNRDLRTRLPNANLNSRLTDYRRPLTPNDLYREES